MNRVKLKSLYEALDSIKCPFGIVIGNFDGVHLGHLEHLEKFRTECFHRNLRPVLITFNPHPHLFFNPNAERFLLDDHERKVKKLESLFKNHVITVEFDKDIQTLDPKTFLNDYILKSDNLKLIHLGHDFKLGKGKENGRELLKKLISKKDILITESSSYRIDNTPVSSSYIRELIQKDVKAANKFLHSPFSLFGTVKKGEGNGKKFFVPTCNINVPKELCSPSIGVYLTKTKVGNFEYDSITNIGINPTVNKNKGLKFETHLFFFNSDIYGSEIEVIFIEKLRDEMKFDSFDELKLKINDDLEKARVFHRKYSQIKLALIGKNISHSKSQKMYEELLKKHVNYSLIDCEQDTDIPSIDRLSAIFQGVSITAPYKTHFLNSLDLDEPKISAINALVFKPKALGVNTDYLACKEIVSDYLLAGINSVHILGSGSMCEVLSLILKKKNIPTMFYSRKMGNLDKVENELANLAPDNLVINCCAREYIFRPLKNSKYKFWDLNYEMAEHQKLFFSSNVTYQDGLSLLKLQAKYALSFWKL